MKTLLVGIAFAIGMVFTSQAWHDQPSQFAQVEPL